MILWIIFALMTAAAITAVLWPFGRGPVKPAGGSDLAVYKDQLQEIDRDRAAGMIADTEAEAARLEVSRRLLAAANAQPQVFSGKAGSAGLARRRGALLATLAVVAFVPPGLYVALGSPNIPGEPLFARANLPPGHESIVSLISQVEAHLERHPNDGNGWAVIAPVYMRLGRYDDAVQALKKVVALKGETAGRDADLGEAEVAAANGVVTEEAKAAFDRAVVRDPHDAKARYFLGLAAEQDGKPDAAAAIWQAMLAEAPAGAPWIGIVREAIKRVGKTSIAETNGALLPAASADTSPAAQSATKGPTASDIAAASDMSETDRGAMIRGMVERLAARLHQTGGDVEGWLRLVRAYVVLGERTKAKDTAAEAKRALADHPEQIRRIDDLVNELGING
jgi:cytochrome c-type biogenesis protein CcmH